MPNKDFLANRIKIFFDNKKKRTNPILLIHLPNKWINRNFL